MLTLRHNQGVQHNGGVGWQVQWPRRFGMEGRTPEQWRREAADHLTGEWTNPPSNRLTHVEDRASGVAIPPNVPQTHWYDANGNMVRENTERHFEWDQADRMKVFRVQTGTSQPSIYAFYLYDSAGMRVKKFVWKSVGYTTTTYLGAASEHHKEVKPGVTQENNHLHVMDDNGRIAIKRVGPVFDGDGAAEHPVQYHLGDHLGSSAVVVSGDGTWINREEFFPYGETSFGNFGRKRYRYTGKERDEESGLYYHGVRYYAALIGRWTARDPVEIVDGTNAFSYSRLNPLGYFDPTGMQAEKSDEEAKAKSSQESKAPSAKNEPATKGPEDKQAAKSPVTTLTINVMDSSSIGFKNFDKVARDALRDAVTTELTPLLPKGFKLEVKVGTDAVPSGGGPRQIDVHLVEPDVSKKQLEQLLEKSKVPSTDAMISELSQHLAAGHGARFGEKGKQGAIFVPVGPVYVDLGGQGLIGGASAEAEARKIMGVALGKLVQHEIGHELGLGHTKGIGAASNKEVLSDPPRIMDYAQQLSTTTTIEELGAVKFTKPETKTITRSLKKRGHWCQGVIGGHWCQTFGGHWGSLGVIGVMGVMVSWGSNLDL